MARINPLWFALGLIQVILTTRERVGCQSTWKLVQLQREEVDFSGHGLLQSIESRWKWQLIAQHLGLFEWLKWCWLEQVGFALSRDSLDLEEIGSSAKRKSWPWIGNGINNNSHHSLTEIDFDFLDWEEVGNGSREMYRMSLVPSSGGFYWSWIAPSIRW